MNNSDLHLPQWWLDAARPDPQTARDWAELFTNDSEKDD